MTTFRIVVVIDPSKAKRGAKQVEKSINQVGSAADRTRQLIARAFAFGAIAIGIRQLVGLADAFTNIQNRIRTVTTGTLELGVVTDELFAIANRTRSAFEATAEVYTRTALATRELGISQRETLQFVESLNQAVILSGASAQEASAGLIQLSQGLASNTLRGDELRSVLEQLPVVADVIAKSLNITRGELRELGMQGKISAEIILKAFREARGELARRFGKTIPTIGQSITILRNNFVKLVGSLATTSGAASGLSRIIILLADNLDTVARVAATAGIALGVGFAVRGVGVATTAVKALSLAIAANPIGAIIIALVIAVSALIAFSDQISIGEGRLANLRDLGKATFEALSAALKPFIDLFKIGLKFIADFAAEIFGDVEFSIEGVLRAAARVIDAVVGFFRGGADAVVIAFENVPAALEAIFVSAFNAITNLFTDFINFVIGGLNDLAAITGAQVIAELKAFELEASKEAEEIGRRMDQAIADGIKAQNAAETALDEILARAEEIGQERLAARLAAAAAAEAARRKLEEAGTKRFVISAEFEEILALLRREGELLKLTGREREILQGIFKVEKKLRRDLTVLERGQLVAQLELNQALAEERAILDEIRGPQDKYARQITTLNKLLEKGTITTEEFTRKQEELRLAVLDTGTDLASGLERGLIRLSQQFNDFASVVEDTLVNAFQSAEDAFLDFVTTGKFEFSSLVNSILVDITRLAIRQSITGPLAKLLSIGAGGGGDGLGSFLGSLFGGGGGDGGGGGPGVPGMAHGGAINVGGNAGVDRNVLSINNRPVARVSRGERITVTPNNGSEGRPIQVNITVVTPDANSFKRSQDQIARQVGIGLDRAMRRDN